METVTRVPGGNLIENIGANREPIRTKIYKDAGFGTRGRGTLLHMKTEGTCLSDLVAAKNFIVDIGKVLEWVGREPQSGHKTLEEAINMYYGSEVEDSPWFEDSYLTQQAEWDNFVWENDRVRFLEELDNIEDEEELDRYQLTWSDEDDENFLHFYEGEEWDDEEWDDEEIQYFSEEMAGQNSYGEEGSRSSGVPIMDPEVKEEMFISLGQEEDRPCKSCPNRNRGLELIFYNKHVLDPIIEERTNLDQLEGDNGSLDTGKEVNNLKIWTTLKQKKGQLVKGLKTEQEVRKGGLAFGRLEKSERKVKTGLGRTGQGGHLPIHAMGQKDELGERTRRGKCFSPRKPVREAREEWKLEKEIIYYIDIFDPGGNFAPCGGRLVMIISETEYFKGLSEYYLSISGIMLYDTEKFRSVVKFAKNFYAC